MGALPLSFLIEERPHRRRPLDRFDLAITDDDPLDHDPAELLRRAGDATAIASGRARSRARWASKVMIRSPSGNSASAARADDETGE